MLRSRTSWDRATSYTLKSSTRVESTSIARRYSRRISMDAPCKSGARVRSCYRAHMTLPCSRGLVQGCPRRLRLDCIQLHISNTNRSVGDDHCVASKKVNHRLSKACRLKLSPCGKEMTLSLSSFMAATRGRSYDRSIVLRRGGCV